MNSRVMLEKGEARFLVVNYYILAKKHDKEFLNNWLDKHIKKLTKFYGQGFNERCRKYMREIADTELLL